MAEGPGRGARSGPSSKQDLPSDAMAVRNVLRSMGVEQHDPRVVNMLLDFMYKYVSEVVLDAEAFSEQTGRLPGEVDTEDITLAIQSRTAHHFVQHPSQALQAQLADQVNAVPLPDFPTVHGIRLPHEDFTLTKPNWSIKVSEDTLWNGRGTPAPMEQ